MCSFLERQGFLTFLTDRFDLIGGTLAPDVIVIRLDAPAGRGIQSEYQWLHHVRETLPTSAVVVLTSYTPSVSEYATVAGIANCTLLSCGGGHKALTATIRRVLERHTSREQNKERGQHEEGL